MYGDVFFTLIRYFSNHFKLHCSDLATQLAPLDPGLQYSGLFPVKTNPSKTIN